MARTNRTKITATGVARYHLMSRTNDRRFLFEKGAVKDELVAALRRAAAFSGVRLQAYTAMSNHFHIVAEVTRTETPVPEEELLRRVGILKGAKAREELAERWRDLHISGFEATLAAEQERLRARMNDISEFIKTFKETFDRWYKKSRAYTGSIWAGRFKSTLVQDGAYLAAVKRYVVYNPIRAGLVSQVRDYRWSWCEDDEKHEVSSGPVPGDWCLRRVVQIGEGKVFGSSEFVMRMVFAMGNRFKAKHVGAHGVGELGYATHGWRLAKAEGRAA